MVKFEFLYTRIFDRISMSLKDQILLKGVKSLTTPLLKADYIALSILFITSNAFIVLTKFNGLNKAQFICRATKYLTSDLQTYMTKKCLLGSDKYMLTDLDPLPGTLEYTRESLLNGINHQRIYVSSHYAYYPILFLLGNFIVT